MPDGIRIVKAAAERVDDLEPLWCALVDHQIAVDPGIEGIPPRTARDSWQYRRANYLRWLAADPDAFLMIAEEVERPVAYALVSIEIADDTHVTGDRIAELESLSVLPTHRGAGLGRRMMEAVFAELRALGIWELKIATIATNERVRQFYERLGFRPWLTVSFGKVPPADGWSGSD